MSMKILNFRTSLLSGRGQEMMGEEEMKRGQTPLFFGKLI